MTTEEPTCTWDGEVWLESPGQRCSKDHCALRGRCPNHVKHASGIITCASCIRRARRDLQACETLHALMLPEAIEAGIDSEAANLAGPAASPEQIAARRRYDEERGKCDWPRTVPDDDPHHPLAVLGYWDMRLRAEFGPETDLFVTIGRARTYLDQLLNGTFPHTEDFEAFSKAMATCRTHLEAVLHDSRQPEQGRPCPTCVAELEHAPRLRKRYAQHAPGTAGSTAALCPGAEGGCKTCTGVDDTWHCPLDGTHWWSEQDYRDRVAVDYVEHADELTVSDLSTRLSVPASTIRRWASTTRRGGVEVPPRIRSSRSAPDGRKLYRVVDVERVRDRDQVEA